jgi:hypothetical protein
MAKNYARYAYVRQRWDAGKRGIEWLFTFEEWVKWWEEAKGPNWMQLRGCHTGQFVMARFEDKGPYAPWNVECITVELNHARYNVNRREVWRWEVPSALHKAEEILP